MGWGESVGRVVESWAPVVGSATLVTGGGLVSALGIVDGVPNSNGDWTYVAGGVLMTLGGTGWTGAVSYRTQRQKADLRAAADGMRQRFGIHGPSSMRVLRDLLDDTTGVGPTMRVSVFAPVPGGGFRLIARYSTQPTYHGAGFRDVYPPNEGLVAKVWEEGHTLVKGNLPKNEDKWKLAMTEQFGISPANADKLRMKSRSYLAMLLRPRDAVAADAVGVLVAESTRPDGILPDYAPSFENSRQVAQLVEWCRDVNDVRRALAVVSE